VKKLRLLKEYSFLYDDDRKDNELGVGGRIEGKRFGQLVWLNKREAKALWYFLEEIFREGDDGTKRRGL